MTSMRTELQRAIALIDACQHELTYNIDVWPEETYEAEMHAQIRLAAQCWQKVYECLLHPNSSDIFRIRSMMEDNRHLTEKGGACFTPIVGDEEGDWEDGDYLYWKYASTLQFLRDLLEHQLSQPWND